MNTLDFWERRLEQRRKGGHGAPLNFARSADRPPFPAGSGAPTHFRHPLHPGAKLALDQAKEDPTPASLPEDLRAWLEGRITTLPSEPETLRTWALLAWRASSHLRAGPACADNPDHSRYDELRVACAASFLQEGGSQAQAPRLVVLRLQGVQNFIQESRKTQDLWSASMLFGELVFAGMRVLIERYGPECIVYPDLLGNPFLDQLILEQGLGTYLPASTRMTGAPTASVPLPHSYLALLPAGGEGHLIGLRELMDQVQKAIQRRWRELTDATARLLGDRFDAPPHGPSWRTVWDRSLAEAPAFTWTALGWPTPTDGRALEPLLTPATWKRACEAVQAWPQGAPPDHDRRAARYPAMVAGLLHLHEETKASRIPSASSEPGEKCTVTGRHQALCNPGPDGERSAAEERAKTRRFWSRLLPGGQERLGAPAALKRYLPQAQDQGFNLRWNGNFGRDVPSREPPQGGAPYPSTAALAAGPYLRWALQQLGQPKVDQAVEDWLTTLANASKAAPELVSLETQHPRALPWLIPPGREASDLAQRFLSTEAQYLHPEVLSALRDRAPSEHQPALKAAVQAAVELRRALFEPCGVPEKEVAVLMADGDGISKLFLGDPSRFRTTWADVLGEGALAALEALPVDHPSRAELNRSRWPGPSLHAAITRMLADFAHRIVPWVIEVEFGGRLIYAGGDDVAALLPASQAVAAAARLQQLFSAPYVREAPGADRASALPQVDFRRDWSWRWVGAPWGGASAAERFRALQADGSEEDPVTSPKGERTSWGTPTEPGPAVVFPQLGRGHALSAGIAFGHFKTPLRTLLQSARDALDREAKPAALLARTDRLAPTGFLAVTRLMGSEEGSTFTAAWTPREAQTPTVDARRPCLADRLQAVVTAFRDESLAAGSPYPLREALVLALPGTPEDLEGAWAMLQPLVRRQVGQARCAEDLVLAGLESAWPSRPTDGWRLASTRSFAQRVVSGLLLARFFAGGGA